MELARLKELDKKLEREGLTENEIAEIALIRSRALLAWRESLRKIEI